MDPYCHRRWSQEEGKRREKWRNPVRSGLMSGSLSWAPGAQLHWRLSESLGATHFSIAPARGKRRAGHFSTNSHPSLIEGFSWGPWLLGTLLSCPACPDCPGHTFIPRKSPQVERSRLVLSGKISVCMGTSPESRRPLGWAKVGTDGFTTDTLQVAGWQKELGQLDVDEWLNSRVNFLEKLVAEDQMFFLTGII